VPVTKEPHSRAGSLDERAQVIPRQAKPINQVPQVRLKFVTHYGCFTADVPVAESPSVFADTARGHNLEFTLHAGTIWRHIEIRGPKLWGFGILID
jgi:hypothetical protein